MLYEIKRKSKKLASIFKRLLKSSCPYCGAKLDKTPSRASVCEHCNQKFFVREGKIITERDKLILDLLRYTEHFGGGRQMVEDAVNKMQAENKTWKFNDYRWRLYNVLIEQTAKEKDYDALSGIYACMARVMQDEGKDGKRFQELSNKYLDMDFKNRTKSL